MKDRVPTYPGRYKILSQSGNYITLQLDDAPSQAGTPLNKETLLQDATATALGLTSAATPNDAFAAIATGKAQIASGTYNGSGNYGSNNKNSITFPFTPRIVFIYGESSTYATDSCYLWGRDYFWTSEGSNSTRYSQVVNRSGKTMYWYSNGGSASTQMNASGTTYTWVAIG